MFRQVLRNNFRAKYKALKTKTQNITEPRRIDSSRLFMYRCFYIVRILCDEKSSAAEISFFVQQAKNLVLNKNDFLKVRIK